MVPITGKVKDHRDTSRYVSYREGTVSLHAYSSEHCVHYTLQYYMCTLYTLQTLCVSLVSVVSIIVCLVFDFHYRNNFSMDLRIATS